VGHLEAVEREEPRELHPRVLVERIAKYAAPVASFFRSASDAEMTTRFSVPFGSGGAALFQHRLRELIKAQHPRFDPPGFDRDIRKYSAERRQAADEQIREIVEAVHRYVVEVLRQKYAEAGDDYLEAAVENKEILKKAFEKRLDDPEKKDLGTYLDFVDLRKIVERPKNWEIFKDVLNIRLPQDGTNKNTKCVGWFDEINKVRRVSAHPYNRFYEDEQVEQVARIHNALIQTGLIESA
jgi:DNA sulfur modification protein DndB